MRPEQIAHDTRERPQRVSDDVECENCGVALIGDRTERYYPDRPLLCGRCGDRRDRLDWRNEWRWRHE